MRRTTNETLVRSKLFGDGTGVARAREVRAMKRATGYIAVLFKDARGRRLITHMTKAQALCLAEQLREATEAPTPKFADENFQ